MSDTKHTPEPWLSCTEEDDPDSVVFGPADKWVANTDNYETARRIVACVNYCAGVDTSALEESRAHGLRELMAAYPDPEEVPRLEEALRISESRFNAMQDSLDRMSERAHDAESQAEQLKARVKELEAELAHTIMDPLAALINGKAKAEAQRDGLSKIIDKILWAWDVGGCGALHKGSVYVKELREVRQAIAKAEGNDETQA